MTLHTWYQEKPILPMYSATLLSSSSLAPQLVSPSPSQWAPLLEPTMVLPTKTSTSTAPLLISPFIYHRAVSHCVGAVRSTWCDYIPYHLVSLVLNIGAIHGFAVANCMGDTTRAILDATAPSFIPLLAVSVFADAIPTCNTTGAKCSIVAICYSR